MYTVGTITELGGTKSIDNDVNLGVYSLVSPMEVSLWLKNINISGRREVQGLVTIKIKV